MAALAALALVLGICVSSVTPAGLPLWPKPGQRVAVPLAVWQKIKFVDVDTVHTGNGALVDVREPGDYAAGHPAGAINLPYRQFSSTFPTFRSTVKPSRSVHLYCYGGECATSLRIASRLVQRGFTNVTIIRGGFEAWKDRELPIVAGSASGG
jgi:rhodanese-related sulfurtransferase